MLSNIDKLECKNATLQLAAQELVCAYHTQLQYTNFVIMVAFVHQRLIINSTGACRSGSVWGSQVVTRPNANNIFDQCADSIGKNHILVLWALKNQT